MNRDLRSDNDLYHERNRLLQEKLQEAEKDFQDAKEESNKLILYQTKAEEIIDNLKKKVKSVEREQDVSTHQYKRYEDELTELKKEYVASQS